MSSVYDFLRNAGQQVYLNPLKRDTMRDLPDSTRITVLRPRITKEPVNMKYAAIEKIIVDFRVELRRLNVSGENEYYTMITDLLRSGRISISSLASYAGRRKVGIRTLLGPAESLISTFPQNVEKADCARQ